VVPIGRPVANTQLYVLDERQRPVVIGAPGELYLGGAQVGRGYHNRPELTAERFVPDPFSQDAGGRLYRTGDRARWRADGTVEYLGRLDFQVKIRGFRIELGEIESVLLAHPLIHDVVVVADGDGESRRLVAYVVAWGETTSIAALREHLGQALPGYMVPSVFVWLPALPLSANGKVDRRALPAPDDSAIPITELIAPRTVMEELVVSTWREILGRERISVTDGFFTLGGNSLSAMRVAVRLGERVGVTIPVRTLFEHTTPALLAAWLNERTVAEAGDDLADLLAELDAMSEEDARALLGQGQQEEAT
jgi:acyl carrier protein